MPKRPPPKPKATEWEYCKVVELTDGSWWIALYHRDSAGSPFKPCWRNVINHARYDPFSAFSLRLGKTHGFAKAPLPQSVFTVQEL